MSTKKITALLLAMTLMMSCSSLKKGKKGAENIVIRYINMRSLYSYILKKDEKAELLRKKYERLEEQIENDKLLLLQDGNDTESIYKRLNSNREKIKSVADEEELHKGKLLNRINSAVKKVAQSAGIDFVLNIGDEVVYGKKKFDITEDVLKELELLEMRSNPVSR